MALIGDMQRLVARSFVDPVTQIMLALTCTTFYSLLHQKYSSHKKFSRWLSKIVGKHGSLKQLSYFVFLGWSGDLNIVVIKAIRFGNTDLLFRVPVINMSSGVQFRFDRRTVTVSSDDLSYNLGCLGDPAVLAKFKKRRFFLYTYKLLLGLAHDGHYALLKESARKLIKKEEKLKYWQLITTSFATGHKEIIPWLADFLGYTFNVEEAKLDEKKLFFAANIAHEFTNKNKEFYLDALKYIEAQGGDLADGELFEHALSIRDYDAVEYLEKRFRDAIDASHETLVEFTFDAIMELDWEFAKKMAARPGIVASLGNVWNWVFSEIPTKKLVRHLRLHGPSTLAFFEFLISKSVPFPPDIVSPLEGRIEIYECEIFIDIVSLLLSNGVCFSPSLIADLVRFSPSCSKLLSLLDLRKQKEPESLLEISEGIATRKPSEACDLFEWFLCQGIEMNALGDQFIRGFFSKEKHVIISIGEAKRFVALIAKSGMTVSDRTVFESVLLCSIENFPSFVSSGLPLKPQLFYFIPYQFAPSDPDDPSSPLMTKVKILLNAGLNFDSTSLAGLVAAFFCQPCLGATLSTVKTIEIYSELGAPWDTTTLDLMVHFAINVPRPIVESIFRIIKKYGRLKDTDPMKEFYAILMGEGGVAEIARLKATFHQKTAAFIAVVNQSSPWVSSDPALYDPPSF